MSTNWRIYGEHTVASRLDRCELPGFFTKKVVVGPTEAAMIVRDGALEEVLTEGQAQAATLLDKFKGWFGGGADIEVYFTTLAPFDVRLFVGEHKSQSKSTHALSSKSQSTSTHTLSRRHTAVASIQITEPDRGEHRKQHNQDEKAWGIGWSADSESSGAVIEQSDVCVVALSADREVINAECTIRLQVDADNLVNLLGPLRGKRAVATWDIAALLRGEVLSAVIVPEIANHLAADLRGNQELHTKLEATARGRLCETLAESGLVLVKFSLSWGVTEQERQQIAVRRAQREEASLRFAKERRIAQMVRLQEIEKARLANLQELKTVQATSDDEYKKLLLNGEQSRDLLTREHRVNVAEVDARVREITLRVERSASLVKLEQRRAEEELRLDVEDREQQQKNAARLAELEATDKEMWSMVKMKIELATQKHEIETTRRRQEVDADYRRSQAEIDDRYQQRKLKLDESLARMGTMERLVSQGLSTGHADASVLRTMLEQATEQEYATTSDDMVKARAAAQATDKNLATYRQAQADERVHQENMTELSARLMAAAKQSPGQIVVPAGQTSMQTGQPAAAPDAATARTTSCPNPECRSPIQAGSKFCHVCGKQTGTAS